MMRDTETLRYIIGIDLGTTNSAISYVDLEQPETAKGRKNIQLFRVPQLTREGEVSPMSVLPSFLYIPGTYDIPDESVIQPWNPMEKRFAGLFAREHGSKVPSRLVVSAKSWLCHDKADRKAKILPWGAGADVGKVSPVEATAFYLEHLRKAWNKHMGGDDEGAFLENQFVVITVPASFDEVARDLTVEAAALAGLKHVTLLEEPLAAFYSWLIRHEKSWEEHVKPGELILVCDVGGGTTDFTLITLKESKGTPRFERLAVGDHLILGGDNIDLALARKAESLFKGNAKNLSSDKWKTLCHLSRKAKEKVLGEGMETERIIMTGSGSSLIGGTLSATLTREMVEEIVLDGFFPDVTKEEARERTRRKGISEFGLPYEQEPAITRHIGWFLENHKEAVADLLGSDHAPDHILFNGGSLKPTVIRRKIKGAVRHWFNEPDASFPREMDNPDPDLAVALGASYYGLAKIGKGVRVGSGSPRSYYLGVGSTNGDAHKAVCIVERGLDEGETIELTDKKFTVIANRPAEFPVYSSSFRSGDRAGDVITIDDTLTELPPMASVIKYGKKGNEESIPVHIKAQYTEVGTLVIGCHSQISDHHWRLNFQLRRDTDPMAVAEGEVLDDGLTQAARTVVKDVFSGDKTGLTGVVKAISSAVDIQKNSWPLSFIRDLSDILLDEKAHRERAAEFEARWLNLTGYCLRPGSGHGMDEQRMKKVWKLFRGGPVFDRNNQVRGEWWILWRRLAAGLNPGQQRQFFQEVSPLVFPARGNGVKMTPQEQVELWMALANMERLITKDKVRLGNQLVKALSPKKSPSQMIWALSRIGQREPLYGSVDRVVAPKDAWPWIQKLLTGSWKDPKAVVNALVIMGRRTGDRMRDLDDDQREQVIARVQALGGGKKAIKPLSEVVTLSTGDEKVIYGESLPTGIVLHE
ncbi:Hsp70 family protein [Desulfoluna spongiiphila]|nr:Hsp70 family protein [Desulfoluna spongiiphila]